MSKQQISPSTRKEMDSFIHGNINAPHFCDFEDVNTLKQYSEEELKPIFGNTNVHYRWVQYAGGIELMSFNPNECVYNFGSIDPSKPVSDILVLEGVEPDNPKTYNETFIISPENNTFKDQFLIDDAIRRLRNASDNLPISSAQDVEEPFVVAAHPEPTHRLLSQPTTERGEYDDIAPEEKMHTHPLPRPPAPIASVHPLPRDRLPQPSPVKHVVSTSTPVRSRYMDAVTPSAPIRKPAVPLTKGTIHSSRAAEKKVLVSAVSGLSAPDRKFVRPTGPDTSSSFASRGMQSQAPQTPKVHAVPPKPASSAIPSYMRETKASAIRASMAKPVARPPAPPGSYPRRPIIGTIVNRDAYGSMNRHAAAAGAGEKPPMRSAVQSTKSVCPLSGARSHKL